MQKIGWGIVGPGSIAHRIMNDLPRCSRVRLAAVASRSDERAAGFAAQYGFERSYGNYSDLLRDPAVDVVYVAAPHPQHHDMAIQAIEAGKAVLCEKPVAVNAAQTARMVDCARLNNVFFMEAMWTRFFPVNRRIKELLGSGALGQVTLIEVDFGFGSWNHGRAHNPSSRLFSPELAGGSLLDVGVYCVSYATWMMGGQPLEIKAVASPLDTGVDGMVASVMRYADGALAVLRSSVVQATRQIAVIHCEKASVEVPDFWHPCCASIRYSVSGAVEEIDMPYGAGGATGFHFEAEEVMDCLQTGRKESPWMTWQDSLDVMEVMDGIRRSIGLMYPFEH